MSAQHKILQAIKDVAEQLKGIEPLKLLNNTAHTSKSFLECDSCEIWLYDPSKGALILRGASGRHKKGVGVHRYKKGDGLTWHIFASQKTVNLTRAADSEFHKGKYLKDIYPEREKIGGGPILGIPLLFRKHCWGAITFNTNDSKYSFSQESQDFAEIIGNQIAMAIDDYYSHQQQKHLNDLAQDRLDFTANFNKELLQQTTLDDIYKLTCQIAKEKLQSRSASIFMFSREGKLERKYMTGFDSKNRMKIEVFKRGQGLTGKAIGKNPKIYGQAQMTNSVADSVLKDNDPILEKFKKNFELAVAQQHNIHESPTHLIAVPLNSFNRSAGVIRIINRVSSTTNILDEKGFSLQDQNWLQLIASLVSMAIDYKKSEIRNRSIHQISELLDQYNKDEVFNQICINLLDRSNLFSACVIRIADSKNKILELKGTSLGTIDPKVVKIKISEGIPGQVFYGGAPKIIHNIFRESNDSKHKEWAKKNGFVSLICLPVRQLSDEAIIWGTFSVYTKFTFDFGTNTITHLQEYMHQIAYIMEYIQDEKEQNLIHAITEKVKNEASINEMMLQITHELPSITGFDLCRVLVKEEDHFRIVFETNPKRSPFKIPLNRSFIQSFIADPKYSAFENIEDYPELYQIRDFLKQVHALVLMPIVNVHDSKNDLYGVIVLATLDNHDELGELKHKNVTHLLEKLNKNLLASLANLLTTAIDNFNDREELHTERRLLKTIINNIPDLIYLKNTKHEFRLINEAQATVLGVSIPEEAIGKTDFNYFPKSYAQKYKYYEELIFKHQFKNDTFTIEEPLPSKGGKERVLSTTKVLYQDKNGKILGLVGIGRDITKFNKSIIDAQKSIEVIKKRYLKFKHNVGDASEELVAATIPGTSINAYAWMIAADYFIGSELFAQYLSSESLKIGSVYDRKLITIFSCKFKKILNALLKVRTINAQIKFHLDDEDKIYLANTHHIQYIIVSLVLNAIKHKKPGKPITIQIEANKNIIRVQNDHPILPKNVLELRRKIKLKECELEGITLFTIHKYFKENYKTDIDIDYNLNHFIVILPFRDQA